MNRNIEAAARRSRLREAGVPSILTNHEAWLLSGGIVGTKDDHEGTVTLAKLALRVKDAEHFLPDWREGRVLATAKDDRPAGHPPTWPGYIDNRSR